ncbi:MAG: hypothetical protein RL308_2028 [Bacteroidota bacterium]|jgi:mannosyltransferase
MIQIGLDNIIFSLQKAGGASVVWQQHLERLSRDKEFQCRFLEYDNAELNFFRQQLQLNKNLIDLKKFKFLFFKKYCLFVFCLIEVALQLKYKIKGTENQFN